MQQKLFVLPVLKRCTKCKEEKPATKEFFYWQTYYNKPTNLCRICIRQKNNEYAAKHRDEKNEYRKQYYMKNKDRILAVGKTRYTLKREKILRQAKKYNADNKEKIRVKNKIRYDKNKAETCRKNREFYAQNREQILASQRQYNAKRKDRTNALAKINRLANPERTKANRARHYVKHKEGILVKYKKKRTARRTAVIAHYSNGTNKCYCCGYTGLPFLTVDHINGDGAEHRKQIGEGNFDSWAITNNYPFGFRIACFNCNRATGTAGICPHKQPIKRTYKTPASQHNCETNQKHRIMVIDHYTNGKLACQCCGYSGIPFLAIDHINGDGAVCRKSPGSKNLALWLIKNNFPTGFQILCHACNLAKGTSDRCPHQ